MRLGFVRAWQVWIATLLVTLCFAPRARATPAYDELVKQRNAADETILGALAPEAVPIFEQACAVRDDEDLARAYELFDRVHRLAPGFSPALRKLCRVESRRGNHAHALELCRNAARDGTAENLGALADVELSAPDAEANVTEARSLLDKALKLAPNDLFLEADVCLLAIADRDFERAAACEGSLQASAPPELFGRVTQRLVVETLKADPSDDGATQAEAILAGVEPAAPDEPSIVDARCAVSLRKGEVPFLLECSSKLTRLAPSYGGGYLYAAIAEAATGDFDGADQALDEAALHHAAAAPIAELRARVEAARPWYARWYRGSGAVVGLALAAWALGLVGLFGVGVLLSRATLRACRATPADLAGEASGTSVLLRRAYSIVLSLASFYYFVSLPIVAVGVLAIPVVVIGGIWAIGFIAPKLFIVVGCLALTTLWSLAKNLVVRRREETPGVPLELAKYPALRALLEDVAARVGTRPVDTVYLTPLAGIGVFERGGTLRRLRSRGERCLLLGASALGRMRLDELRAVLAHEYGHFSNRDTAGGDVALAVRRSLLGTAASLARSGVATRLNPGWLFTKGFYFLFLRISQGASRLQEILADRWAAQAYGADAFARGLASVVRASVEFDHHVNATMRELARTKAPLQNLYEFEPAHRSAGAEIERDVGRAMDREPSPYDSHPSPRDRIAFVRAFAAATGATPRPDAEDAAVLAWSLFPDRAALELELTRDFLRLVG